VARLGPGGVACPARTVPYLCRPPALMALKCLFRRPRRAGSARTGRDACGLRDVAVILAPA
jgi:hypothetical protein